jgi:hypothetical protein
MILPGPCLVLGSPWNFRFRSPTSVASQRHRAQQVRRLQALTVNVQDQPTIGWIAFTRQGPLVRSQYRPPSRPPDFPAFSCFQGHGAPRGGHQSVGGRWWRTDRAWPRTGPMTSPARSVDWPTTRTRRGSRARIAVLVGEAGMHQGEQRHVVAGAGPPMRQPTCEQ